MIAFLVLCFLSTFAGLGLLILLGAPLRPAERWLLAPGTGLVGWTIVLGIAISLGAPVRYLVVPFWAGTMVLALYGLWKSPGTLTRDAWPLLVAVALPLGVMIFDVSQGLNNFIGGPAPDGWSYVAQGQRLWEMAKDTQGHFAPLYQYASHLQRNRFIASALLAVFSPLAGAPGDTQAAAGYFVAWSLFLFGTSCAAAAVANQLRLFWVGVLCAVAVASRWVLGAVEIHNYDNLIAISFLPMTMGLVAGVQAVDWRAATLLGAFLAATVYCYPEMAAFVGLGTALTVARRILVGHRPWPWIISMTAGVTCAALLLLPAARDLTWYIGNQVGAATATPGARAGEGIFPELVSLRNWSASVWGLESHAAAARLGIAWELLRQGLSGALWLIACAGWVRLVRQRRWDIAAIGLLLILGAIFMSVQERYSYGAYKFLLLGWWALAWYVVAGTEGLIGVSRARLAFVRSSHVRGAILVCMTLPLVALLGSVASRIVVFRRSVAATSVQPYRRVLDVERVIGREPLVLVVDDDLANEWAVYFLRDHPLQISGYRGYMAMSHVVPVMEQAAPIDLQAVKYVLSDEPHPTAANVVWSGGPYTVWRIPSTGAAFLRAVTNPNGAERIGGRSFYWIGQGETQLDVVATSTGEAVFTGRFIRGPSLPDRAARLLVGAAPGIEKTVTITEDGEQSFSIPVHAGENRIYIRPLDQPSVRNTDGRDPRPLLLGVQGLSVSLGPTESSDVK